jgi:hypothetical protein
LTFPVGAHVHDQRARKDYRVEPDGELRELSQEDLYPTRRPVAGWMARNAWEIILAGCGVVVCFSVLLVRRWVLFRAETRKSLFD